MFAKAFKSINNQSNLNVLSIMGDVLRACLNHLQSHESDFMRVVATRLRSSFQSFGDAIGIADGLNFVDVKDAAKLIENFVKRFQHADDLKRRCA